MYTLPGFSIGDLTTTIPIIQGGMGIGISLSGLASAVANEGGIGVIATAMIGMHEPDLFKAPKDADIRALKKEIRKARGKTDGILGVNIMVAATNYAEIVKTSIAEGIDIIFTGAGLPLDLPKYLQDSTRTKLVPIVSSGRAASVLCKRWLSRYQYLPDAFVVEGPMAGGHLGLKRDQLEDPEYSLENLVPDVLEAVQPFARDRGAAIPVIAAGGIFTGADIYKFLQLGVAGVQMGTRFVGTYECDADDAFKHAYVTAKEDDIVIIDSPVGLPGRAIRNPFLEEVEAGGKVPYTCPYQCIVTCDYKQAPYCIALALVNAKKGRLKHGFVFAGKNAYRVERIIAVKELIAELKQEYMECMKAHDHNRDSAIAVPK